MYYIGLMSGTSVDGIDAALLALTDPGGLKLEAAHSYPYSPDIQAQIQGFCRSQLEDLAQAAQLDVIVDELFADAANALLNASGVAAAQVSAIGSHGQTLRHEPRATHPYSIQIGNPAVIAERTGITTVADFRARDIAAGGEGAPRAPAFHRWLFHSLDRDRVVLNIGGIANISYLPADQTRQVVGFDTGPGNTLLDQWASIHLGTPYDKDGAWGAGGTPCQALLEALLADRYVERPPPKRTGRAYFNLEWLNQRLARLAQSPARSAASPVRPSMRSLSAAGASGTQH